MTSPRDLMKAPSGQYITKGLFFEKTYADKSGVLYTLKEEDHLGYLSIHKLYVESDDPTEYNLATNYFFSYSHWQSLCECNWFKPYLEKMKTELELKLKSRSLSRIIREASSSSKESYQANKFLVQGGYQPPEKNTKGRPSKKLIEEKAQELAFNTASIDKDFELLTLTQTQSKSKGN